MWISCNKYYMLAFNQVLQLYCTKFESVTEKIIIKQDKNRKYKLIIFFKHYIIFKISYKNNKKILYFFHEF